MSFENHTKYSINPPGTASGGFSCRMCKKKFRSQEDLNYHDMYHSDEDRKKLAEKELKKKVKKNHMTFTILSMSYFVHDSHSLYLLV